MPLGDSITQICEYRQALWQKLTDNGYTSSDFDFVGTSTGNCPGNGFDADHEGHGGYLVTEVATEMASELGTWAALAPDLVLMHFGTNDVWNGRGPGSDGAPNPSMEILDAFDVVVDELRAANPDVWILVAQLIPMAPDETTCSGCTLCTTCPGLIQSLNDAIPGWATAKSSAESPVLVVDQFAGFDVVADTTDLVHPNAEGGRKMADRWYEALVGWL
jgi:lysophospholipase L1-like esterase